MAELVASRYSTALFKAGEELDKVEKFYEELEVLKEVIDVEPKFLQILGHPKISKKEKKQLIDDVFEGKMSEEVLNFLYILIDKNRQDGLIDMVDIYEDLFYDYKDILRVVAITSIPMEEEAKDRLSNILSEKMDKEIELSNEIDEAIIGGIRLELEGKLIDGTIKGKLESMARNLKTAMK